jgi:hypothetical protein
MLADMANDCYCMDTAVCRALQLVENRGERDSELAVILSQVICFEGHARINDLARKLLMSVPEGKDVNKHLKNLDKMAKVKNFDLIGAKKKAADIAVEAGEYKI